MKFIFPSATTSSLLAKDAKGRTKKIDFVSAHTNMVS